MQEIKFKEMWETFSKEYPVFRYSEKTEYINLEPYDVEVFDNALQDFVKCKKLIKNTAVTNWTEVKFSNGIVLRLTDDHPLYLERGRTHVQDIEIGDKIRYLDIIVEVVEIRYVDRIADSYDVETVSDRFELSGFNSGNCRTRSYEDVNGVTQTDAKGNLWFTTINLPAIAIRAKKAKDPIEAFFTELQQRCEQCRDIMEDRYELIAKRHYENFPFLLQQGVYMDSDPANHKPEDEIREVLKHGSNAIGYIGIYEVCKLLLDKTLGVDQEAFDLGYRIVKYIRDYTDKVKKETHQNWSCFATPAENVCGRFAELDKKRYGEIPDITDKGYYTNSHMLPFDLKTTLANKLKNEAPFHKLSNGGHIFYHKLDGNPAMNVEAVKKAIRAMYDADLGYFTITFDQDRCRKCGHIGIIADECPNCGAKDDGVNILRIRRITGYLVGRPGQSIEKSWGTGKQNELKKRVNI